MQESENPNGLTTKEVEIALVASLRLKKREIEQRRMARQLGKALARQNRPNAALTESITKFKRRSPKPLRKGKAEAHD